MPKRKTGKQIVHKAPKAEVLDSPTETFPAKRKNYTSLIIAVAVVIAVFYFVKSWLLLALVNGVPITRMTLISELEKRGAKQTLDSLVTKTLIFQEAEKQRVTVTNKEIEDELTKIKSDLEKQGQKLDDVLKMQAMTQDDLKEQIKMQKIIEKILGPKIQITDAEVNDFLSKNNPNQLTSPTDEEKQQVKEQLKQQKLSTEFEVWLKGVKEKAKINYFVTF